MASVQDLILTELAKGMRLLIILTLIACGSARRTSETPPAPAPLFYQPLPLNSLPPKLLELEQFKEARQLWPLAAGSLTQHPRVDLRIALGVSAPSQEDACVGNTGTTKATKQHLEYVLGWCAILKGDDTGRALLLSSSHGPDATIADAARHDLAYVMSDGDADVGVELLNRSSSQESSILELLASYYAEKNRFRDALQVLEAIDAATTSGSPDARCHRLVNRAIILSKIGINTDGMPIVVKLLRDSHGLTECRLRASAVVCELSLQTAARAHRALNANDVLRRCRDYTTHTSPSNVLLMASVVLWGQWNSSDPEAWLVEAELAAQAIPDPAASEIAVLALENYLRASDCHDPQRERVNEVLRLVQPVQPSADIRDRDRISSIRRLVMADVRREECHRHFRAASGR